MKLESWVLKHSSAEEIAEYFVSQLQHLIDENTQDVLRNLLFEFCTRRTEDASLACVEWIAYDTPESVISPRRRMGPSQTIFDILSPPYNPKGLQVSWHDGNHFRKLVRNCNLRTRPSAKNPNSPPLARRTQHEDA